MFGVWRLDRDRRELAAGIRHGFNRNLPKIDLLYINCGSIETKSCPDWAGEARERSEPWLTIS